MYCARNADHVAKLENILLKQEVFLINAQPAFDGGWGVAFSSYHADGLADAIGEALGRLPALKARASGAAGAAKDELASILQSTVEAARARRRHGMAAAIRRLLGRALEAK